MKKTFLALLLSIVLLAGCASQSTQPTSTPSASPTNAKVDSTTATPSASPTTTIDANTTTPSPAQDGEQPLEDSPTPSPAQDGEQPLEAVKMGDVGGQEWEGTVLVAGNAFVPSGKTLVVKPGTRVLFAACRGYRGECEKAGLSAEGKLTAVGTPQNPIWFSSNAASPQNGDWSMIRLVGKTGSRIGFAVIEFGLQGVNLWNSDAVIDHSIVRWNNWEGLYAESYSTPAIEYNRVYQNGYNGMALEQFNDAKINYNLFKQSGTNGLHVDATKVTATGNFIVDNNANGLSLDDNSQVVLSKSTMSGNGGNQVDCGQGVNSLALAESVVDGTNSCEGAQNTGETLGAKEIDFGYEIPTGFDLGYTPSDPVKDKYLYAYPDDETRTVVKKLGVGKGLAWSVALDGKSVLAITVGANAYEYDGDSGELIREFTVDSPQPWGATFLDGKLWVTDFAEKRTYSVDPKSGKTLFSFDNPDQERGAKGLANDGKNLLLMGWTTSIIYNISQAGELLGQVKLQDIEAGGGLAFDGENYWVPCANLCKFDKQGKLLGKIYAASEGTWDLEWDSQRNLLWATQRTNENWQDAKVFALKIGKEIPQ